MADNIESLYNKILQILPNPNKNVDAFLKDLKSVDSTSINILLDKIYTIISVDVLLLNKMNFEILLNDPRLPKLSYLLSFLYYFYSNSPFTRGRYTNNEYPLVKWLQKLIILGDNQKFAECKQLALRSYVSFT